MKCLFYKLFYIVLNFNIFKILCSYLKTGKKVFDNYVIDEMYDQYINQFKEKQCSLEDGPNCFFTDKYTEHISSENINYTDGVFIDYLNISNNSENYNELNKKIKEENDTLTSLQNIKNEFKQKIINYEENNKLDSEKSKLPIPINYTLYLTFESFDHLTQMKDIYMQKEFSVPFTYAVLSMKFIGQLRLSYEKEKNKIFEFKNYENFPKKTYGIIESNELFIIFNQVVTCNSLYARNHFYDPKYKMIYIEFYLNLQIVQTISRKLLPYREWTPIDIPKINFDQIKLQGGIDIDNINLKFKTYNQYDIVLQYEKYLYNKNKYLNDNEF